MSPFLLQMGARTDCTPFPPLRELCIALLHMHTRTCMCGALCDLRMALCENNSLSEQSLVLFRHLLEFYRCSRKAARRVES